MTSSVYRCDTCGLSLSEPVSPWTWHRCADLRLHTMVPGYSGIEEGVRTIGNLDIAPNVSISAPAELMAKDSAITIGDGCDIAAFVTISTADSHGRCIGLTDTVERKPILIEDHVFIGTGAVILGGCVIGHHSVIGAGVVLKGRRIPPYSRVTVDEPNINVGYYSKDPRIVVHTYSDAVPRG